MADGDIGVLYGKVNKLEVRMEKIEATRPFLEEMIDRDTKSNEKLAEVLQDVQLSMAKMNDKMDAQALVIDSMKEDFAKANKQTNERIGAIGKKVDEIEEKGKFDIWDYIKKNLPWIIVVLGIGTAYASTFVKM